MNIPEGEGFGAMFYLMLMLGIIGVIGFITVVSSIP